MTVGQLPRQGCRRLLLGQAAAGPGLGRGGWRLGWGKAVSMGHPDDSVWLSRCICASHCLWSCCPIRSSQLTRCCLGWKSCAVRVGSEKWCSHRACAWSTASRLLRPVPRRPEGWRGRAEPRTRPSHSVQLGGGMEGEEEWSQGQGSPPVPEHHLPGRGQCCQRRVSEPGSVLGLREIQGALGGKRETTLVTKDNARFKGL